MVRSLRRRREADGNDQPAGRGMCSLERSPSNRIRKPPSRQEALPPARVTVRCAAGYMLETPVDLPLPISCQSLSLGWR